VDDGRFQLQDHRKSVFPNRKRELHQQKDEMIHPAEFGLWSSSSGLLDPWDILSGDVYYNGFGQLAEFCESGDAVTLHALKHRSVDECCWSAVVIFIVIDIVS